MGTEARPPLQWPSETRSEFESLVCEGGEVTASGLSKRIDNAVALACHHDGTDLIGVAAIKKPADTYRSKISDKSGFDLKSDAYPFELGWVYVKPNRRGGGLAKKLVAACLKVANSAGVYATTREDNDHMRCCLAKNGFKRVGQPYMSERGNHYLVIYAREKAVG